jgi:DNA-binding response OmpR family regulator
MGVLVLTGYASLETAIEAVRLRAWDYVTKPCQVSYLKERVDAFLKAAPSAAPNPAGAAPPDESSLRAFLDGAGTELLAFDRIDPDAQSHRVLDELRRVCGDLGFEGERTAGLVQIALEAIAALCDGDVRPLGRAALLEGHLLVGFSAPRSGRTAADSLRAVAERLGLHARLLPCDGTDSIVLSERV